MLHQLLLIKKSLKTATSTMTSRLTALNDHFREQKARLLQGCVDVSRKRLWTRFGQNNDNTNFFSSWMASCAL
jgi:hypothetical protein